MGKKSSHAIIYVGLRPDGAYVVVTRSPKEQHFIHIGAKDEPMTTIEVKESRPNQRRLPYLRTDRGDFYQTPDSTVWGRVELRTLNPSDYYLETEGKHFRLRWA